MWECGFTVYRPDYGPTVLPGAVRSQAQRAGADIVEVEGSHVIMISQPQVVTEHILKAVQAVAGSHR